MAQAPHTYPVTPLSQKTAILASEDKLRSPASPPIRSQLHNDTATLTICSEEHPYFGCRPWLP